MRVRPPSLARVLLLFIAAVMRVTGGQCSSVPGAPGVLPVFIEDNHSGSFAFFALTLDLDQPHTLVLVDAHSDATAADHSDELRDGIRRVRSDGERRSRIDAWRKSGRLQAYNWIEPLLPRPFSDILWVPAAKMDELKRRRLSSEAADSLDGRLGFEARQVDALGPSISVTDFDGLDRLADSSTSLVVSLDLDFFAGMSRDEATRQMEQFWSRMVRWPRLCAVSIAISRPWLASDDEAFFLLDLVLGRLAETPGVKIEIQPWLRPLDRDDSLRAREWRKQGKEVPRFDWSQSPPRVRARLLDIFERVTCRERAEAWQSMVAKWRSESIQPSVRVNGATQSLDGIWRIADTKAGEVAIHLTDLPRDATGRARWFSLVPRARAWNLLPGTGLAKSFVEDGCSPWVSERRQLIAETSDPALAASAWCKQMPEEGFGRVKLAAEIETPRGWLPVPPFEVRTFTGESGSFRAALSDQFGLPYVFGIGMARDRGLSGADLGWGNDCANFLVAAWRRSGRDIPWCNPAQLREHLRPLSKTCSRNQIEPVALSADAIRDGVVIDFGQHVAAIWRDEPPLGVLNAADLVAHHLGGFPEIIPLARLLEDHPTFVVRAPTERPACTLVFGGDVVLADSTVESISHVFKSAPEADVLGINLEGVASLRDPPSKPRFDFRFAPDKLALLRNHGVSFASLGNNHAMDAGDDGLIEGIRAIEASGIRHSGAGTSATEAARPVLLESNGVRLAVFGVACLPIDPAGESTPGICQLPAHEGQLALAMQLARDDGRVVIVMPHWGVEHSPEFDDSQREWAGWFVAQGASLIVGSHPHVVQPLDFLAGVPVALSLGNCVFPEKLKGADNGAWLTVILDSHGNVCRASLVPIQP